MQDDSNGLKLVKRPGQEAMAKRAEWMRLSEAGGTAYKGGQDAEGYDVLPRYDTESSAETSPTGEAGQYERRLAATPVLNIMSEFIRQRRDGVMRANIIREQLGDDADPRLLAWASSVDRAGAGLDAFMGERLREGLLTRYAWIGVDSPTADMIADSHHGNEATLPWATVAPVEDVYDYELDGDRVTRVAIRFVRVSKGSITKKAESREEVVEWTPDEIQRYTLKSGRLIPDGPPEVNGFGFVPWFRLEPLEGEWYSARFDGLQRSILQTRSDMIAEQKANTYTEKVFWGVNPAQLGDAAGTPGTGLAFDDPSGRLDTVGGVPEVMVQLRENLAADLAEAQRRSEMSGVSMSSRETSPESGLSRRIRKGELSALLAGLAERVETAENRLIGMWARVAGFSDEQIEGLAASRYPREFDLMAEADRQELLTELRTDQAVPVEVKRAALWETIQGVWPHETQARAEMHEAVEAMADSPARDLLQGRAAPRAVAAPAVPFGGALDS